MTAVAEKSPGGHPLLRFVAPEVAVPGVTAAAAQAAEEAQKSEDVQDHVSYQEPAIFVRNCGFYAMTRAGHQSSDHLLGMFTIGEDNLQCYMGICGAVCKHSLCANTDGPSTLEGGCSMLKHCAR